MTGGLCKPDTTLASIVGNTNRSHFKAPIKLAGQIEGASADSNALGKSESQQWIRLVTDTLVVGMFAGVGLRTPPCSTFVFDREFIARRIAADLSAPMNY
jgi:hypothetical protein